MGNDIIYEFWDRSKLLNLRNKRYSDYVKKFFEDKLKNDMANNDITTKILIKNDSARASIVAKEDGIAAGIEECSILFKGLKVKNKKKDGEKIKKGQTVIELDGKLRKILQIERTGLNFLQRMSGIAAITYNLNKKINKNVKIAATRKTLWDLLDKKAVSIGNGLTHRLNLSDGILIKDNHIKALNNDIEKALILSNNNSNNNKNKTNFIEIEVTNKKQALKAALTINSLKSKKSKKVFAIMFDNMSPKDIKKTIEEIKNKKLHDNILFEASGNINEKNITEYSKTGIDIISLGFITHSAKALDIALEIK